VPRGPKGEKRPADVVSAAHKVFQIAVGEENENLPSGRRRSGFAGAIARSNTLTKEQRSEIAKKASKKRWEKED